MSKENVEAVRRSIEAYNRRDFDAMYVLNDPAVELDWSRSRGFDAAIYRGRDEVLSFYRNFLDTFVEIAIEPFRFIETPDSVVVPNSAHLKGRDGIELSARSALVFDVRGGLVTRLCLYQTLDEALEAVGLPA
jgi:ketosteroid isomerase-like protein